MNRYRLRYSPLGPTVKTTEGDGYVQKIRKTHPKSRTRIELQGTRIIYRKDGPAWDGKPQDATIWQMPDWYKREIENG